MRKHVFLKKQFENIGASLYKLKMSLLGVEENVEHFVGLHPVDQILGSETLNGHHTVILDNLVKVPYTLNSSFEVVRLKAHK